MADERDGPVEHVIVARVRSNRPLSSDELATLRWSPILFHDLVEIEAMWQEARPVPSAPPAVSASPAATAPAIRGEP